MMQVVPLGTKVAGKFVGVLHRHHGEPPGGKYAIGAMKEGRLVGVAIGGRPVAEALDDGTNAECTRLCTDGTDNACSFLYGAVARVAKEMGYRKIYTYTLISESGESLRAAGWVCDGETGGVLVTEGTAPRGQASNRPENQVAQGARSASAVQAAFRNSNTHS